MNITFMIGNGFDIGLGLKTSFKQFFPVYYAQSLRKDDTIKQLSKCISDDEDTWAYFEKQLGEYTANFDSETVQNYIAQFRDFTLEFIDYLRSQEKRLSFSNTQGIAKKLTDALTGFYKDDILPTISSTCISKIYQQHAHEEHQYNFISFNYTDALQRCLGTIKDEVVTTRKYSTSTRSDKIGSIVNVHGTKDSFPIMGVNDPTQISNQDLAIIPSFTDRLVKPQINSRIRMNNDGQAIDIINSSTIICIYGMSLGITDRDWWDRVITWLYSNSTRQLVIFIYDTQYSATSPMNWMDIEDKLIEQLSSYTKDTSISVDKLRNRIHIAIHKNIFTMPLTQESDQIYTSALELLMNA